MADTAIERTYRPGEAARFLGISYQGLRWCEENGRFPKATRTQSGRRIYSREDLTLLHGLLRVARAKQAKALMAKAEAPEPSTDN